MKRIEETRIKANIMLENKLEQERLERERIEKREMELAKARELVDQKRKEKLATRPRHPSRQSPRSL